MTLFNLYMIILLFLNQNILSVWSNNALSNISYDRTDLPYPLHPNIMHCVYSPYCSLYIPKGADKENLFHNQGLL